MDTKKEVNFKEIEKEVDTFIHLLSNFQFHELSKLKEAIHNRRNLHLESSLKNVKIEKELIEALVLTKKIRDLDLIAKFLKEYSDASREHSNYINDLKSNNYATSSRSAKIRKKAVAADAEIVSEDNGDST